MTSNNSNQLSDTQLIEASERKRSNLQGVGRRRMNHAAAAKEAEENAILCAANMAAEAKLQAAEGENARLASELEARRTELTEAEEELEGIGGEIYRVESSITRENASLENIDSVDVRLEAAIKKATGKEKRKLDTLARLLKEKRAELLQELTKLQEKQIAAQAQLLEQAPDASVNDELEELKARNAKLENSLKQSDDGLDRAAENIDSLTAELRLSKTSKAEMQKQLQYSEMEKSKMEDTIKALKTDLEKRAKELASVQSELTEHNAEIEVVRSEAEKLQQNLEETLSKLHAAQEIKTQVEALEARISKQETEQADCEAEIKGVSEELKLQGFKMKALLHTNAKQGRIIVELRGSLDTEV